MMSSREAGQRSLDLDVSAVLIGERLVGEILGWDRVDWMAVEPHKGRKFFFGRQHQGDASIHHQLQPLLDQCDPARQAFSALKPSPVVNTNLSKLVGCLCRHAGSHALPEQTTNDSAFGRTAEQDYLHLAVIDHVLGRVNADQGLKRRAQRLKRIAAAAESELEKHFADLINRRLEESFLPGGGIDRYRIHGLRDQAKGRVADTQARNAHELAGLSMPALGLDNEALIRIEMAKILLSRFPYIRNYELMLHAEIAMLQRPLMPRFVQERRLFSKADHLEPAQMDRWDRALAHLADHVQQKSPELALPSRQGLTMAICGSGPLPLTALFLHLFTGASLVLLDDDPSAIDRSERLIANLEALEILSPGALIVRQGDAGSLSYSARVGRQGETTEAAVVCDAVMIASLVDPVAKTSIAAQFKRNINAPDLLIMRSATGLSAELAYDPVPTETISHGCLAYCGETLPTTQLSTHQDRIGAIRRNVTMLASADVLAIAHPDVVNSTEVYRRFPNLRDALNPDPGAFQLANDRLCAVEQLCLALGSQTL